MDSEYINLPPGWEKKYSKTNNREYYFNVRTGESRWDAPIQLDSSSPQTVTCRHLLVKHVESRRPISWRGDTITRTKEEASQLISQYRESIENGKVLFETLAREKSDCSSAKNDGDLGQFEPFEEAA